MKFAAAACLALAGCAVAPAVPRLDVGPPWLTRGSGARTEHGRRFLYAIAYVPKIPKPGAAKPLSNDDAASALAFEAAKQARRLAVGVRATQPAPEQALDRIAQLIVDQQQTVGTYDDEIGQYTGARMDVDAAVKAVRSHEQLGRFADALEQAFRALSEVDSLDFLPAHQRH